MKGPCIESFAGLEKRNRDYEIYNFFVWLKRIAPECPLTNETIEGLCKEHPDFAGREHPELDHWSSGVQSVDPVGGLNLDEVEAQKPEKFLEELLDWKPQNPFGRSRASYCGAVSAVVTKNPEWGISWVHMLLERRLIDADLWYCVCQGWRNASLAPGQWRLLLDLVETIEAPAEFFRS